MDAGNIVRFVIVRMLAVEFKGRAVILGWAKYYEDNVRIIDDRMYFKSYFSAPSVTAPRFSCPYCLCSFSSYPDMADHIVKAHSNQYAFFIVNGMILKNEESEIAHISEIKAMNYGNTQVSISVIINEDTCLIKSNLNSRSNMLDVTKFIAGHIAKSVTLIIETPEERRKYTVIQRLDIHDVNNRLLGDGLYKSSYFFDDVAYGHFNIPEYRILLSILSVEHDWETAEMVMEKVNSEANYAGIDADIIADFYLYYSLMSGTSNDSIISKILPSKFSYSYKMMHALMSYDFDVAEEWRAIIGKCSSDFEIGVCLLLSYLKGNETDIAYYRKQYSGGGILRDLIDIMDHIIHDSIDVMEDSIKDVIFQLNNFYQYPLVCDMLNIFNSITSGVVLNDDTYTRLSIISPLVCAIRIMQTSNEGLRQKYAKSAFKRFSDVQYAQWFFDFCSDYLNSSWSASRITKKVPDVYWKYVENENNSLMYPLSAQLIDDARQYDDIAILPLGSAVRAGCSCFVLSFHGFNILLDAGIYPGRKGEDAYPEFELFSKPIDAIVISHAHLDHSGAVSRAHSIWPDAPIIATAATKALLEPFLHDIAVHGKIDDETEMEFIDRTSAIRAYNAIVTVDFNEWIPISHNLRIKLHPAGHLLGAAIVEIKVGQSTAIYTGDFSTHSQKLCSGSKISDIAKNADVLICESTYYHTERDYDWIEQHEKVCDAIVEFHNRGKTILLPSNALGRSQELLCIISDLMENGRLSSDTQIYVGGFACKLCVAVAPVLNEKYKRILEKAIPITDDIIPVENSVIICSSGSMRRNTTSFKIAEKIRKRNRRELVVMSGGELDNESVKNDFVRSPDFYPLSVHSSYVETEEFIKRLNPKSIVFVHSGTDAKAAHHRMVVDTLDKYNGRILPIILSEKTTTDVWDIKNWIEEEKKYE